MNFKGIKNKLKQFKAIFRDHWSDFVAKHDRLRSENICIPIHDRAT